MKQRTVIEAAQQLVKELFKAVALCHFSHFLNSFVKQQIHHGVAAVKPAGIGVDGSCQALGFAELLGFIC